jgi:hypothetical protein
MTSLAFCYKQIETNCFSSARAACQYFFQYWNDSSRAARVAVDDMIASGSVTIGQPETRPHDSIRLDSHGRYFIVRSVL